MLESTSSLQSCAPQSPLDARRPANIGQTRRPLQMLEAAPLNKRPKPVATSSSPLNSSANSKPMEPSTPPTTPLQQRHKRSSTSAGSIKLDRITEEGVINTTGALQNSAMAEAKRTKNEKATWENTTPRAYTKQYQHCGSGMAGTEELGRGVWSVVYRSAEMPAIHPTSPLTPPNSPIGAFPSVSIPSSRVLAVKAPSRKDACKILEHEARILTYLHSFPQAPDYLVPFHGYDQAAHSILLSAIPLNLDIHVKTAAKTARANLSTRTMFDPVVGIPEWMSLATSLVSGLSFLHSNHCIHGDIKPANILLQPSQDEKSLIPLYCDFSSSLVTTDPAPPEITALTQDFSSPELLASLTDPTKPALPTSAADIYALGVTLLFAAIGESPYVGAKMEFMKLSMAKEGRPLQFAKCGEQAARVRKEGLVDRCISRALTKDAEARWDANHWRDEVEKVIESSASS